MSQKSTGHDKEKAPKLANNIPYGLSAACGRRTGVASVSNQCHMPQGGELLNIETGGTRCSTLFGPTSPFGGHEERGFVRYRMFA